MTKKSDTQDASSNVTMGFQNTSQKNDRKNSGIHDFLSSISSTATLPEYIKGKGYSSRRGVLNQCIATFGVIIFTIGVSQPMGYSAILLPQLYKENSTMRINVEMGSWIASIHSAATPIGAFTSGPLMDAVGRKRALQLAVVPLVTGWVVISTATSHASLIIGRIVAGFGVGLTGAPCQVYLGEISEPRLRGILSALVMVAYSFGIVLIYLFGAMASWRTAAALSTILPLLSLVVLMVAPESPTWLARKRRFKEASASIARLRGSELTAQRELHQLMSATEAEREDIEKLSFWATVGQLSVMKPLAIVIIFNVLQILSGTFMIVLYAVDIISAAAGGSVDGVLAANISAVVRFICTIVASISLFYTGRRVLVIVSGVGSTAAMFALGTYIWCTLGKEKNENDFWITTVCLLLFIIFNTIGFFIFPSMMTGELLPARVRGICGGWIFVFNNASIFGTAKLLPLMLSGLGVHGMFIFFGTSSLVGTIFMYLFMPETKGTTLFQIEKYFQQSNYLWITRQKDSSAI